MIRDDVKYRMLERLLGLKLTPARMAFLEERGYTGEIHSGDLSTVAQVANEISQYRRTWGRISRKRKKGPVRVARYTVHRASGEGNSTRAWEEAVSVYLASQAKECRAVQTFRAAVLHGELLPEEHVEQWLRQKYQKQGIGDVWFANIHMSADEHLSLQMARAEAYEAYRNGESQAAPESLSVELPIFDHYLNIIDLRVLQCWVPGLRDTAVFPSYKFSYRVLHIVTAAESVLEELRTISVQLAESYGWDKAEAALFVLTDKPPFVRRAATSMNIDPENPVRSRVMLTIDPTMTVEEVATYYRQMQAQVLESRHRGLTIKRIELAKWAVARLPGETWRETMHNWNAVHPEWAYPNWNHRNFHRDCLQACERLLEPKIQSPQEQAGASEWHMTPSGFVPLNEMAELIAMREAFMNGTSQQ